MKFSQKLEVILGVLFSMSEVFYMYFVDYPSAKWLAENQNDLDWGYWSDDVFLTRLVSLIAFPLVSYLHAARRSQIAFGCLMILGALYALTTLGDFLVGSAFRGHMWIGVSPGLFAFATMLLAFANMFSKPESSQML